MKKQETKSKIVQAAWDLFYRQGYENTTIDDIVEASGTSKGSFYHYFEGKDSLPASLSYLFDEKYEELEKTMDPSLSPIDKLVYMNQELFLMIENTVSVDILGRHRLPGLERLYGPVPPGSELRPPRHLVPVRPFHRQHVGRKEQEGRRDECR